MKIRIPATSANLGPGFDSCGIALSHYLNIEVLENAQDWKIMHSLGSDIPNDATNLLIQTALKVAPNLSPKVLKMTSDIPLARGLGSSSSVIVGGIELANRLGNLNLSQKEKVQIATEMEGHPDNVAPAICGDFVVASYVDGEVHSVKHHFPMCDVIAYIPEAHLLTSESRSVLPTFIPYKEAVQASSIANVMIAAILNGNLPLAGLMMEKDRWHEAYRKKLVPHLDQIRSLSHKVGAYGAFLSGAGPTVLILSPEEKTNQMVHELEKLPLSAAINVLSIDQEGIQVF
ncbi:homoserine kinase [Enterococcus haemoperoxidus ATCC BAA-382]|uniref:Homoserine kinase n=1 Tax=Enterococcus haemoperoxidus ATCC BAA-382 TaxID=1158608 RepID=R2TI73_9ENTE|nr:homoserine kinase [Enterococcus haemoperoxidus]EOH99829.1 homoserine kinase [Enterococcus haemoperoxidus ATCC BAA-382]EOT62429.1 homoserine kinase [Enterococcus haemoperoxidus ATCC BAA-382]